MAGNDEGDGGGAREMRQDLLVENPTECGSEAGQRDDGAVLGEIAHLGVRERQGGKVGVSTGGRGDGSRVRAECRLCA